MKSEVMIITLLICFVLCCAALYVWSLGRRGSGTPPTHPGALPLTGNAHQFLGDNIQLWTYLKELAYFSLKSGGVSTVYLGPKYRIYFVTDPDDCLTLSNATFEKPFVYDIVKEWADRGLVTADVPIWKRHRKHMNPMFSQQMLNENLEVFNRQARRLIEQISVEVGKQKFNTRTYLLANITETICRRGLNKSAGENFEERFPFTEIMLGLNGSEYDPILKEYGQVTQDMLEVFIAKTQKLWLHVPFIYERSSYKKKLDKCIETASGIIGKIIKQRKEELKANYFKIDTNTTGRVRTFLDLLLTLAENQGVFNDDEIREHLETLIVAGYDTTTETLTFALALIGSNEQVQNKIYKELQEVLGDTKNDVNKYDLHKLVYLDTVVSETIRMCPTVSLAARNITSEIKLKNYTLQPGSIGVISAFGVHRHPLWGADVEQFRPKRWLEPTLPDNPSLFAGFSLGKRNCIGKWYAMISMKTSLAHFLRHYRVTADVSNMVIQFDISSRAVTGHEICIERRNVSI